MAEVKHVRTVNHLKERARLGAERISKHRRAMQDIADRIRAEQDQQAIRGVTQT